MGQRKLDLVITHAFVLLTLCNVKSTAKSSVSIVFGGDVDYSRLPHYLHNERNCSYAGILRGLEDQFKSADYSLINLETTIRNLETVKNRERNGQSVIQLFSEEAALPALKENGIKIACLANNHIMDFEEEGTNETIELLNKHNMLHFGVIYGNPYGKQKPLILEKNGIRIGILAYCDMIFCENLWKGLKAGAPLVKTSHVIAEANSLRNDRGCDIIILFMHWGVEFSSVMAIGNAGRIRDILQGAKIDAIVGGHPHVKHPHWYVNNTLVATSLGNLVFPPYALAGYNFNDDVKTDYADTDILENLNYKQMLVMNDDTMKGKLLKVVFNKKGIVKKKTKYLNTRTRASKQHCIAVGKGEGAAWRTICESGDPECTGTSTCNYVECDGRIPLPKVLPPKP